MTRLTVNGKTFDLRRASAAEIIDLRWAVLRTGLPRSEAHFPADDDAETFHYAAIADGGRAVSCATIRPNEWEDGTPAYQLRGMATDSACRSFGLGAGLLTLAEEDVRRHSPVRLLWCNARTPALKFYERQGWRVRSDEFHIPTAGPHFKMTKAI